MCFFVVQQLTGVGEASVAKLAVVGHEPGVDALVVAQVARRGEAPAACAARVGLLPGVHAAVAGQLARLTERLPTHTTPVPLVPQVDADVALQSGRIRVGLSAELANEVALICIQKIILNNTISPGCTYTGICWVQI